ncbi:MULTISPECIES: bifunctional hydroxymethylpyrimidine kinase/phosphomethylpyrimidine kinase [Zobellia]|uniref:bifunctional hydroxymethylpyrimidine kinase/phosphomethylpyrimidine kinase n=1 Tax=Zobellia TaxID=112040 RepID=UPI001BFF3C42|nr:MULTISPECIES: bifunctional hydroxymethylpyrimidine kinase/phosphomethylpyrimidine kinase [Zobellia]MBT9188894.1 bifunctional hydroxymethylpyrimidine kinase/phosphomethylpyrimidine kinase [Zobellia russellii]MBU2975788.1 bifunctional hydroxymethylpyrimidine kinase/phosphomethylpyrimidine kinase [Zobellia sp. B3R18]
MNSVYPCVLTIAGSDSGGCAGIQADIKSISANGAFAASVITATTAQNTRGVFDIHAIPVSHIRKQLIVVLEDIEFGAIKIGMLHSAEVIETVKKTLKEYSVKNIVLDPVMVATSGDRLLNKAALDSLKSFLGDAYLITPNIPEAEILIDKKIDFNSVAEAAKEIGNTFKTSVLLKGGHLEGSDQMTDTLFLYDTQKTVFVSNKRIHTKNTHGTGCTLSSAIAAQLSLGYDLEEAVKKACSYLNKAILQGKDRVLGMGHGPVQHFPV